MYLNSEFHCVTINSTAEMVTNSNLSKYPANCILVTNILYIIKYFTYGTWLYILFTVRNINFDCFGFLILDTNPRQVDVCVY